MAECSGALLQGISGPSGLKKLTLNELGSLAEEIRNVILQTVSKNGGHLSSNLGVVELSIALHRYFDSPNDKIIWDVGHQCYAHKILTGRLGAFDGLRKAGGISGFPRRSESCHDAFDTGHASTSVSAALGYLAAGGGGRSVAVIGDGALTGGLSYEALCHAGHLSLPLIVILNDNRMSISKNEGALSHYLSMLSLKPYYQTFRRNFDAIIKKVPLCGDVLFAGVVRLKRAVKAVFYHDNFFVDLGYEYAGPVDGHNLAQLEKVLKGLKNIKGPVVVHVITQKGRGYKPSEDDPSSFHSTGPFSLESGLPLAACIKASPNWTKVFGEALLCAARKDNRIIAVTAAMENGTGLTSFKKEFPDRFFDVGIAEEHAITFCAALAAAGKRPVACIYSTFIQRSYDQIVHDTALQNLSVVFILDRAGFVSDDGETHQGLFDISIFRAIPGMTILCPATSEELKMMLSYALSLSGPSVIRYPKAEALQDAVFSEALRVGRGCLQHNADHKSDILIAFTGSLYTQAFEAAQILQNDSLYTDLYNLRFLKPIDKEYLCSLLNTYKFAAIVEEGIQSGGFGEYVCTLASASSCSAKIICLNAGDKYYTHNKREALLSIAGLDGAGISSAIIRAFKQNTNG
ncbi:MAG: 1-deoxy-D-xylulose-5-phosphate synthase [Termitinemataceae bacterium]|nr:MAG: 1-deoxy-D-xylulose-5-phosphate synthase [Termitinemataceae bacterium]